MEQARNDGGCIVRCNQKRGQQATYMPRRHFERSGAPGVQTESGRACGVPQKGGKCVSESVGLVGHRLAPNESMLPNESLDKHRQALPGHEQLTKQVT